MRKLAQLETVSLARSLAAALTREGIANEVREQTVGQQGVWVLEEDQLDAARDAFATWTANPEHVTDTPNVPVAPPTSVPAHVPSATGAHPTAASRRARGVRVSMRLRSARAPLTMFVIAVSVAVAMMSNFGARIDVLQHLTIKRLFTVPGNAYQDLQAGELWRLITPAIIHFGLLHLVFNAFWLLDLGGAIERAWGTLRFGAMLVVSAVLSNLAQLYFGQSPAFGGLSGVVYACVGYLWARGRFDPQSPIGAPPQLVTFFVAYLALGFTGLFDALLGPMANYCHLGGFVAGSGYGGIAALQSRHRLRRSTQA